MGTFSGTNTGPLSPMKKTNKAVNGQYAAVLKLKHGKIAEPNVSAMSMRWEGALRK